MAAPKKLTPELKAQYERMHNMTAEVIADELGDLRQQQKVLKDKEELLKTVLKSKIPSLPGFNPDTDAIGGKKFILEITTFPTARFSQEKAKEFLTEEQFGKCFVTSEVTQIRTKARGESAKPNEDV